MSVSLSLQTFGIPFLYTEERFVPFYKKQLPLSRSGVIP